MAVNESNTCTDNIAMVRMLRWVGRVEGMTLLALVFIGVPLKHWAGVPTATAVLGPLHGLVFLAYLWACVRATTQEALVRRHAARIFLAALLPFGTLFNDRLLGKFVADLRDSARSTSGASKDV
jgi:integral membrane protein